MLDIPVASRMKIERAQHHINDLQRGLDAYFAEMPYKLMVREQRDPPTRAIVIRELRPIPNEIALVLGDAIHNLRASLDITIFGLIGDRVADPSKIQFPYARRPENVAQSITSRQIDIAGKHVVDAIKKLHFYEGGNRLLSALHNLDVADKHKLIIPTVRAAAIAVTDLARFIPGLNWAGDAVIRYTGTDSNVLVMNYASTDRQYRRRFRDQEIEAVPQPSFIACFGNESSLGGHLSFPLLWI